jgi:hypothetical protein
MKAVDNAATQARLGHNRNDFVDGLRLARKETSL